MRTCKQCQEAKPLDDFKADKHYHGGRLPICRVCLAAKRRERRARQKLLREPNTVCDNCGFEFWADFDHSQGRYCSRECAAACRSNDLRAAADRRGHVERVPHSAGYVLIWRPEHPRATNGRVFEHIVVAEEMVGRPLEPWEHVHHINEVRDDNRPENLEIVSASEHLKRHMRTPEARERMRQLAIARNQSRDPATGRYRKDGA